MQDNLKKLFFLPLLFLATAVFSQDDAIGKFFGKYVEDSRFTIVSVSPKMFRLLAKANWDSIPPDLKQTVTSLHSLRILSTETTPRQFYKEALSRIDMKEYEELITVRDKNDNVHFVVKESGGTIHELLMIAVDEDGFTLMSFVGDIDLDKMSKLSSSLSIKGMENLKNAKRKNR
ncbi:DUF4252 domain-containing protein [Flavitalea sp. BT771]|uniref:DUF4252 domain-containing protein n=1 Tax=Flavitalea sp. BT771 TaxID=3063329 RepID=UPI0026E1EFAF|nr:DUF4252 domain-containing protein [Flavitalea sp. BT771]MDO6430501.1 DUF4252 domain-containing protein [Flavitalea sp. BT771]MDV6219359.1 DUF4252 domain-containing protein [Flavitalea sp. BT771]